MFDVGFTEILVIGVVALVVIGPERLPDVARSVGRWVGKLQRFVRGVRSDLASEFETGELKKLLGDQREQIDELRNMVNSARKDFEKSTNEALSDAGDSFKAFDKSLRDDDKPAPSHSDKSGVDAIAGEPAVTRGDDTASRSADSAGAGSGTDKATGS